MRPRHDSGWGKVVANGLPFIPALVVVAIVMISIVPGSSETASAPAQNSFYPNNRAPLRESQYVKLPLGAVKPRGWLRDQLVVESNGLTGHLPDVWDVIKTSAWKGDAGKNMLPMDYERFLPRWLEGVVPLAYELDDPHLKAIAHDYMQYVLDVRDPATVTPSIIGWSHLGRVLPDYYEATHDERAIQLAGRILRYAEAVKDSPNKVVVEPQRRGMVLSFGWWYYNQTGDATILGSIDRTTRANVDGTRDYFTHFAAEDKSAKPGFPTRPGECGKQGVDLTQSIQYPVIYYLLSGDQSYPASVAQGIGSLDQFDGQVAGRWNADELLSGTDPTQGTELCDVTELSYSLMRNFEALGDVTMADRLEKLIFNALPAALTPDMWAHQYDQQANQVLVSADKRNWHADDKFSNIFGFTPNFPCCLANMHSPFPRYVEYMWMATNDRGLVAAAYGPSEVTAKVGEGTTVDILEETRYPFGDSIKFTITCDAPARFPVSFRIPSWADRAEMSVAGEPELRHPEKGSMVKVERDWKSGDVVSLNFHAAVRTETRRNNAVSIAWGPLYFVERIGEAFTETAGDTKLPCDKPLVPSYPVGVVNWRIDPTTDWNYALDIDRKNPQCAWTTNPIGSFPFAQKGEPVWLPGASRYTPWQQDVPLVLTMKARKVAWTMHGPNAGEVPFSPVGGPAADTTIELIPYGCSRLRIAEFPTID